MANFMLNDQEQQLVMAIQGGFPLTSRPFLTIGEQLGQSEAEILASITNLQKRGIIKRLGVVVRHRELGYHANAMTVWDVPEAAVAEAGKRIGAFHFVTLCYQRQRSLPHWPYNLYCMIHGREREEVLFKLDNLQSCCGLETYPRQVLFSLRCFKQRGAHYFSNQTANR